LNKIEEAIGSYELAIKYDPKDVALKRELSECI